MSDEEELTNEVEMEKSPPKKGLTSFASFHFPGKHRFDDWNKFQLVTVLVADGQVIRDENYLSLSVLQSFAEAVFLDRPMPEKPRQYSLEEQSLRHTAALTIQNAYFSWLVSSNESSGGPPAPPGTQMHDVILAAMHSHEQPGANLPNLPSQKSLRGDFQQKRPSLSEKEIAHGIEEDEELQRQLDDDDDNSVVQNSILDQEFIPPSLEYATLYADFNHPRVGGLGSELMPWLRTSTGIASPSFSYW